MNKINYYFNKHSCAWTCIGFSKCVFLPLSLDFRKYSPRAVTWPVWWKIFNPNPGGYINWRCPAARSHIWPPRRPIGEMEALRHAAAIVKSSEVRSLHLERARGLESSLKTAWCADYWQGECPGRGRWWRESKESNMPQFRPECKKMAKNSQFCTLFG